MNDLAWIFWTAGGLLGAAGLALLAWSLFWDRARGRKRCPKCWYDMSGAQPTSDQYTCPECGRKVSRARQLQRTRRRWRWALAATVLLIAGGVAGAWPRIERDGWPSVVPVTVLRLAARPFPEGARAMAQRGNTPSGRRGLNRWQRLLAASHYGKEWAEFALDPKDVSDPPAYLVKPLKPGERIGANHHWGLLVWMLSDLAPESRIAIPDIEPALDSTIPGVRREALRALGILGPYARSALLRVECFLDDPDEDVRDLARAAAQAIRGSRSSLDSAP